MTSASYRSDYELTKDTPSLALMGELWSVFLCVFWRKNSYVLRKLDCAESYLEVIIMVLLLYADFVFYSATL